MIFAIASLAILVSMGLAMLRALLGPTVFDRILAVNMFGTKTVLLIAVLGFFNGRPDFLDLALAYALMNFIGVVAVLKFVETGGLDAEFSADDGASSQEGAP